MPGVQTNYVVDEHYDPDLFGLDEEQLKLALAAMCVCGHSRGEHMAATGALGSFGGTACNQCWACGTFTSR